VQQQQVRKTKPFHVPIVGKRETDSSGFRAGGEHRSAVRAAVEGWVWITLLMLRPTRHGHCKHAVEAGVFRPHNCHALSAQRRVLATGFYVETREDAPPAASVFRD
jgi:hypothetical protein